MDFTETSSENYRKSVVCFFAFVFNLPGRYMKEVLSPGSNEKEAEGHCEGDETGKAVAIASWQQRKALHSTREAAG